MLTKKNREEIRHHTSDAEETQRLGARLAECVGRGTTICFWGDLGAGKTTMVKGVVAQAAGVSKDEVLSPTFVLLQLYEPRVAHFDLYRLGGAGEFVDLGFDEILDSGRLCCIEWPERIASLLPIDRVDVTLVHAADGGREIVIDGPKGFWK